MQPSLGVDEKIQSLEEQGYLTRVHQVFGNFRKNHTLPPYGEKKDNEVYFNIYLELCKSLSLKHSTCNSEKTTTIRGKEIEIL